MNNRKLCDFTNYVKYISSFSPNINNIKDDLISYYVYLVEGKHNISQLSHIITILHNELGFLPKYISSLIGLLKSELANHQNNVELNIIEKVFFELIQNIKSNKENSADKLLCILSQLEIADISKDTLKKIYSELIWLERQNIITCSDLYLTLLSQNNIENLKQFLEYDISQTYYKFLNNMFSNNVHWLIEIINGFKKNDLSSSEIKETLNGKLLHLIMLTISENEIGMNYFHPIENLTKQLENSSQSNTFIFKYCQEQCRKIAIARFCYENSLKNTDSLFQMMQEKSLLCILNDVCVLSEFKFETIMQIIENDKNALTKVRDSTNILKKYAWERELYTAYFIVITCARAIIPVKKPGNSAQSFLEVVKQLFDFVISTNLRLEVLQYMFSLLFLRNEHISWADLNNCEFFKSQSNYHLSGFLCSGEFVEDYLVLLKECIDETIKRVENEIHDADPCISKLTKLSDDVAIASWRMNLLTHEINYPPKHVNSKKRITLTTQEVQTPDVYHQNSSLNNCNIVIDDLIRETIQNESISLILSPPESLLIHCLLKQDFQNAQNVIQKYKIKNSYEAEQVRFIERYIQLQTELKNARTSKHDNLHSNINKSKSIKYIIEQFIKNYKVPDLQDDINIIQSYKSTYPSLLFYSNDHNDDIIIADLLMSICSNNILSNELINLSSNFLNRNDDNPYRIYMKNVIDVFHMCEKYSKENISIQDVIVDYIYPRDVKLYKKFVDFDEILSSNISNLEHINRFTEKSYKIIVDLLNDNPYDIYSSGTRFRFMEHLLEYLHNIIDLIKLDPNYDRKINMLNFLNVPLKNIIGDLVHEKGVLASDVESITSKMGVNLIEILTSSLCDYVCPTVAVDKNEYTFDEIEFDNCIYRNYERRTDNISNYKPDIVVMTYLRKRNWLLSYLIEKLYHLNTSHYMEVDILQNLFNLERTRKLMHVYGDNEIKSSLNYLVDIKLINKYFDNTALSKLDMLDVLRSLPEIQYKHSAYLRNKKNVLLSDLSVENWKYVQFISDIELQYRCIIKNLHNWDEQSMKSALQCIIENVSFEKLALEDQQFLKRLLEKVSIFEQVLPFISDYTWLKFQSITATNTGGIFETLLQNKQIDMCLNWIALFPETREILCEIDDDLMCGALEVNHSNILTISKFLHELDTNQALVICEKCLHDISNISAFKVFGQFVLHHESDLTDLNLIISISFLMDMDVSECISFFKIIFNPLLIVEQYLMNCKFDKLTKIVETIKKKLNHRDSDGDNAVTLLRIDKLLISYAKKSLLFDVPNVARNLTSAGNDELIQPLESPIDEEFTMPLVAPKKTEWIPNELANECMCCRQLVFTMFNRRHHCRRCGRVVCGLCSMNRLKLSSYNDLNVRVCNQCYDQTKASEGVSSDSQTGSDENSLASYKKDFNISLSEQASDENEWVLTGDTDHDNAIREEFSFIHAPSVSLCLAILSLHNDSEEAPNFLLSECEAVIRIMKPKIIGLPNNEIDYPLLIEMMRSMAIAAKVKFSHLIQLKTHQTPDSACDDLDANDVAENKNTSYFYAGISRCEDILNYADLANLLVQHGCEGLLTQTLTGYDIQVLREQLVRSERWVVALDVSLKAGLDRSSVFAAWGKACLRAGAFRTAREKFSHCLRAVLDPTASTSSQQEDIFTVSNFEEEKYSTNVFKYSSNQQNKSQVSLANSATAKNRPQKDPLLLNEITDILEKSTYTINGNILKNLDEIKQSQESLLHKKLGGHMRNNLPEPAMHILHTLSNLKNITNGVYDPVNDADKNRTQRSKRTKSLKSENIAQFENIVRIRPLEKFIFDECKYYLTTYGSHVSIIKFYMKHSTLNQVLEYILNNNVDESVFTEAVYMECLKKGSISALHHQLSSVDPSLLIWKDHLSNTCRHLEKSKYMNTLYNLQLFMKDHVRASMTCIYFYCCDCTTYTHLHQNVEHLNTAERYLRQELESVITATSSTFQVLKEASASSSGFIKKLSYRELDKHINTICKQREVAKFLAACEIHGRDTFIKLNKMFATHNESNETNNALLPTLFGSQLDRLHVATLVVLCGQNVEEGFGLAFRIAQDYQLQGSQLYRECARYLARCGGRLSQVAQLCRCVRTSGLNEQRAAQLVDELAAAALYEASALDRTDSLDGADAVVRAVTDIGVMISCYINIRQLKSAYLLAVKHDRLVDVRRIQREAERLGQNHVVALCTKRLNM